MGQTENKRYFAINILATLLAALSLVFLTCFITDRFNTAMAFINNIYTKILLIWALAIFDLFLVLTARNKLITGVSAAFSALYGLVAMALFALVIFDFFNRSAIIFTREPVKYLFAAGSLLGVAVAVATQINIAKAERNRA